MKIHLKLPGGAELRFEREPMSLDKLIAVCITIGVVAFFASLFGAIILR